MTSFPLWIHPVRTTDHEDHPCAAARPKSTPNFDVFPALDEDHPRAAAWPKNTHWRYYSFDHHAWSASGRASQAVPFPAMGTSGSDHEDHADQPRAAAWPKSTHWRYYSFDHHAWSAVGRASQAVPSPPLGGGWCRKGAWMPPEHGPPKPPCDHVPYGGFWAGSCWGRTRTRARTRFLKDALANSLILEPGSCW